MCFCRHFKIVYKECGITLKYNPPTHTLCKIYPYICVQSTSGKKQAAMEEIAMAWSPYICVQSTSGKKQAEKPWRRLLWHGVHTFVFNQLQERNKLKSHGGNCYGMVSIHLCSINFRKETSCHGGDCYGMVSIYLCSINFRKETS